MLNSLLRSENILTPKLDPCVTPYLGGANFNEMDQNSLVDGM